MEVTEIRPVKDAQDLEALAQYVEASMDQTIPWMPSVNSQDKVSQPWEALDIQPFTSKKSMGPLPLNLGSV